jgi:hypothetical protein
MSGGSSSAASIGRTVCARSRQRIGDIPESYYRASGARCAGP